MHWLVVICFQVYCFIHSIQTSALKEKDISTTMTHRLTLVSGFGLKMISNQQLLHCKERLTCSYIIHSIDNVVGFGTGSGTQNYLQAF